MPSICGMDLAIVGTRAIASIFANDKIHENWGDWVAITGIAVVFLCIDLIGKLLRFLAHSPPSSHARATVNGVLSQLTFLVPKDDSSRW